LLCVFYTVSGQQAGDAPDAAPARGPLPATTRPGPLAGPSAARALHRAGGVARAPRQPRPRLRAPRAAPGAHALGAHRHGQPLPDPPLARARGPRRLDVARPGARACEADLRDHAVGPPRARAVGPGLPEDRASDRGLQKTL